MTAYIVGDIPNVPIVFDAEDANGEPLDLTSFSGVEIDGFTDHGTGFSAGSMTSILNYDNVSLGWPPLSLFHSPGIYTVVVTLTSPMARVHLEPYVFVVESAMSIGWHTLQSARAAWASARDIDDPQLWTLLETSKIQCEAYGYLPTSIPGPFGMTSDTYSTVIPPNFRQAQLMQARAIWQSVRAAPNDQFGSTDTVSVYPMDSNVRRLLRPRTGRLVVG